MTNKCDRYLPYIAIVGTAMICHSLLLFNDGTYWDDWVVFSLLKEGTWERLHQWNSEMGLPILAYFFWGLKITGLLGYHHFIAFALILTTGLLTYLIGLRLAWAGRYEILGITLLSLTFPANQTTVLLCTLQYLLFYSVFLLAMLMMLESGRVDSSTKRQFIFGGFSLALFFFSFSLNSLLVFYFPVLLLLFVHFKEARALSWAGLLRELLSWRLTFLLVPFVYWGIKKIFFPAHGAYKNYNRINLDKEVLRHELSNFLETPVYHQSKVAITGLLDHPLVWIIVMIVVGGLYLLREARFSPKPANPRLIEQGSGRTKWFLALGIGMLFCGMFPYAVVSATPALTGWDTRHAMLMPLPLAILIVAILRPLWLKRAPTAPRRSVGRLGGVLLASSLIAAFGLSTISYYVGWQARSVKDRAIMAELADNRDLRPFSIYWIDDQYPLGGETYYSFYEWSSLFKQIWGGESRIGLRAQDPGALVSMKPYYNALYNTSKLDVTGRQVSLTIRQGSLKLSETELALRYLRLRLFKPEKLAAFLPGVVLISVQIPPADPR